MNNSLQSMFAVPILVFADNIDQPNFSYIHKQVLIFAQKSVAFLFPKLSTIEKFKKGEFVEELIFLNVVMSIIKTTMQILPHLQTRVIHLRNLKITLL